MSAAWPQVIGWLNTTLPTLSGWSQVTVFDGPADTGDPPGDYATVGFTVTGDTAGEFSQATSDDGLFMAETGHVFFDLACQSGDDEPVDTLAVVRARCFGLLEPLRAMAKADPTLGGVLSVNADNTLTVTPLPVKNTGGTAQALVVTFGYYTLVYDL